MNIRVSNCTYNKLSNSYFSKFLLEYDFDSTGVIKKHKYIKARLLIFEITNRKRLIIWTKK